MELCPSNGPVTFESLMLEETQVITSATVVRRQRVLEAGLFDENLHCAEDHDLWLRIAYRGGKITYQRAVLAYHLVRSDSQGSPSGRLLTSQIEVLRKIDRELDLFPQTRALLAGKLRKTEALLAYIFGRKSLLAGDYQQARKLLSESQSLARSLKLGILLTGLRLTPGLMGVGLRIWDRWSSR